MGGRPKQYVHYFGSVFGICCPPGWCTSRRMLSWVVALLVPCGVHAMHILDAAMRRLDTENEDSFSGDFLCFFFLSSKAAPFVCVLVFLGVKRWENLSFSVVEQKSSWIWIRFDPHFRHRYCSSRGRSGMPFTVVWGEKCGALVAFEIAGKLFKLQWYIYSSQVPPN